MYYIFFYSGMSTDFDYYDEDQSSDTQINESCTNKSNKSTLINILNPNMYKFVLELVKF